MVEKEGEEIKNRALKLMEKANLCLKEGGWLFIPVFGWLG